MVSPGKVAFTLFGVDIMWYGVLIGIGMLLACSIAYMRAPRHEIDKDRFLDMLLISVPVGIVGARLYYVVFEWERYADNLGEIFNIRNGGLAIHGGLIFGLGCAAILCKVWKVNALDVLDIALPSVALAQAIGRWGNFFNEEAHGGSTDFPINVLIDGQTYHATFLYESVWCLLLCVVLLLIDRNRKFKGQIALLYGILYSLERFFVEGLRTDSLMIGDFRMAQLLSLTVIAVCIVLYIIAVKRQKKGTKEI